MTKQPQSSVGSVTAVTPSTDVPGPRKALASLVRFRRDPLEYLSALAADYGDVVRFSLGRENLYLINSPDYIRDVLLVDNKYFKKSRGLEVASRFLGRGLLTSEAEFHQRQRRLAQPAFHRDRIASYAGIMVEYSDQMTQDWAAGETRDLRDDMMALTLSIVAKTLFDADVKSEVTEIGQAITDIMRVFTFSLTLPFYDVLERVLVLPRRRFLKAKRRLDETIYRIIDERRRAGVDHGDLLSMLLLAHDDEGDQRTGMTDEQVRDEAMTLFLAGHETTANALTWTWYLLSQHPDAEARLYRELEEVLDSRRPGMADFEKLPFTEAVFKESLRLYPPAWTVGRRALADYRVGDYLIPAGSILLLSQWVTHHDARFFPDPFKFDPDRWTGSPRESRPKFSYYPFGGGVRGCIGEQFAWMEGVLVVAAVARRWRLKLAPGHVVALDPLITLRPKYGMRMVVEPR